MPADKRKRSGEKMTLNRRYFIGGILAAAAAPRFSIGSGVGQAAKQAQGSWVDRGLIDGGGSHEPYLFVVRRGGQRLDAKQACDYPQSEELIRQLHSQGVEVFHTHFYKGFGIEAEHVGMEATSKSVEIAYGLGMKDITYLQ